MEHGESCADVCQRGVIELIRSFPFSMSDVSPLRPHHVGGLTQQVTSTTYHKYHMYDI